MASARAPCGRRRRRNVRLAVRLRPLRLPLRQGSNRPGGDAGVLLAETREPFRGEALERRLLRGGARAWRAAWNVQGELPDRVAVGGVRDGQDFLLAARPSC